jgi:hypothetical protein
MTGILGMLLGSGGGSVNSSFIGNINHTVSQPSNASVGVSVQSNGTVALNSGNAGSFGPWWSQAPQTGIGSNYWVRHTTVGGAAPTSGSGSGTWINLSGGSTWSLARTTNGTSTGSWRLEIASDAAGTNIVATNNFTATATRDP